jgi:hypothetical protein
MAGRDRWEEARQEWKRRNQAADLIKLGLVLEMEGKLARRKPLERQRVIDQIYMNIHFRVFGIEPVFLYAVPTEVRATVV